MRSAATRVGSFAITFSVTFAQGCFAPQYVSLRASTSRSPFAHSVTLYGPVPTAALIELKSAVVAPFAIFAGTMNTRANSNASFGFGDFVLMTSVSSPCFVMLAMPRTNCAKEFGELGTFGTRSYVAITSSALKALPS